MPHNYTPIPQKCTKTALDMSLKCPEHAPKRIKDNENFSEIALKVP